jgi:hypothetical protein
MDISFGRRWPQITVLKPTLDTLVSLQSRYLGYLTCEKVSFQGDTLRDKSTFSSVGFRYDRELRGISLNGYTPPDKRGNIGSMDEIDTITTRLLLHAVGEREFRAYFPTGKNCAIPFYAGLGIQLFGECGYGRRENIEPPIPDSLMSDGKFIDRGLRVDLYGNLRPAIGIGRPHDISAVYYALELERALLKSGAINFPLAEDRIIKLATIIARNRTYHLRNYARVQQLKAEIDSTIVGDEAVKPENLRLVSIFDIRDVLLHFIPPMFTKPRGEIFVQQRLSGTLATHYFHYPYNIWVQKVDTSWRSRVIDHDALLGARVQVGLPLTDHGFLSCSAVKPLLNKSGPFATTAWTWRNAIDVRWNLRLDFWQLRSSYVTSMSGLSIDDIPTFIAVPNYWPYRCILHETLFFEDYFSINIDFGFYQSRGADRSFVAWQEPFDPILHGLAGALQLIYRF